ncbi:MAG: hypothetical protein ACI83P_002639, partial [Janthinobacterium sp.]
FLMVKKHHAPYQHKVSRYQNVKMLTFQSLSASNISLTSCGSHNGPGREGSRFETGEAEYVHDCAICQQ